MNDYHLYQAKDYIQTPAGLIFAVVADGLEAGRVRCFLRYRCLQGQWQKLDSEPANRYLAEHHPEYLFYSPVLDARLHGVALSAISKHYAPRAGLQDLLNKPATDAVLADFQQLCRLFLQQGIDFAQIGVTGSLLLGLQHSDSDIDLVCYCRETFQQLRRQVQQLIAVGQCRQLNESDWQEAYQRRGCELTLEEYIWHERRKYNKAIINRRKFDLSLLAEARQGGGKRYQKLGVVCLETQVLDDAYAFDYPAELAIDHPEITTVVSFTATYNGQAQIGEQIQVAGQLEQDEQGLKRIVVGSSREAVGEYIKRI